MTPGVQRSLVAVDIRSALTYLWVLPLLGGVFAACATERPSGEDVGATTEALSCPGSVGNWTDFPYGPPTHPDLQCVGAVILFYESPMFRAPLNGSAGPCGPDNGACNYWVTESSWPSARYPSVWERHPWGTATPQTYDMVVFKEFPNPGQSSGHVASVDHVASDGTLWVTDSNYGGTGHGECPHPISWPPYGFYRLKALAVPPAGGSLDSVTCQSLDGSAQDPSSPGTAISVEAYVDGPKGTGTLLGSIQTNAAHSFSLPTPLGLYDGRVHSIYVYAIPVSSGASEGLLANAPATLHCAAPLSGDFYGTGRDDLVEFRNDWETLPACGQWGSSWSCNDRAATFVGGSSAGNAGSGIFADATALVGDVNGDGRSDVIEWNAAASSIPVCLSAESGWACKNLAASYLGGEGGGNAGSGVFNGSTAFAADVNGDGRADIVQFDAAASSIPVCFATDEGWACENLAATYISGVGAGNAGSGIYQDIASSRTTPLVGDVNGDGQADLVQWNPAWSTIPECFATNHGWACANNSATYVGGASAGNSGSGVYPHSAWVRLADVNGDGKADLVQFDPTSSSIPVCFSTDRGWSCDDLAATFVGGGDAGNNGSGVYPATAIVAADVNGDGRADILQYVAGSTHLPVCFSTERGWSCQNLTISSGAASGSALPYGLPVVGKLAGNKGIAFALAMPESSSGILPTCIIDGAGWRCANDVAGLR